MRLYNWFGGETFICTIALLQRPMLFNTVYTVYIYTAAASVTTAATILPLVHEPDRVWLLPPRRGVKWEGKTKRPV